MRKSVPLSELKFLEAASTRRARRRRTRRTQGGGGGRQGGGGDAADELAYKAEVQPPSEPPTKDAMAADEDAKYAYIKAYKDAGNALFKAGMYAWAIRTYCDAVDALQRHCYESRERMLWDYFARGPCGQCYSNAALCAAKGGEHARAARLCEQAMECRPEDTDLVKVLLRSGRPSSASAAPPTPKRRSSAPPTRSPPTGRCTRSSSGRRGGRGGGRRQRVAALRVGRPPQEGPHQQARGRARAADGHRRRRVRPPRRAPRRGRPADA